MTLDGLSEPMEERNTARRSKGESPSYLPLVDGLRAVAVLMVLASHLPMIQNFAASYYVWKFVELAHFAYFGVDIFFVLSGFLITRLLLKERERTGSISFSQFFIKRALRILPIYYLCVLAMALIFPQSWHGVPSLLVFVFNYYHAFHSTPYPMEHAWSLAVEEQFYLLWPFLIAVLPLSWGRRVTGLVIPALALLASMALAASLEPEFAATLINKALPTRMLSLSLGAYLAFRERDGALPSNLECLVLVAAGLAIAVLAAGGRILGFVAPDWYWCFTLFGYALIDLALLSYIALGKPLAPIAAVLQSRPMVYIGRISYGLYLYHLLIFFVLGINEAALAGRGIPAVLWVSSLVACFAVAALSFELFEKPIMGLRRSLLEVQAA